MRIDYNEYKQIGFIGLDGIKEGIYLFKSNIVYLATFKDSFKVYITSPTIEDIIKFTRDYIE